MVFSNPCQIDLSLQAIPLMHGVHKIASPHFQRLHEFLFLSFILNQGKCHGCLFAPEGAEAAVLMQFLITSIGTFWDEKSLTDLLC